jgi:hypothetical protein
VPRIESLAVALYLNRDRKEPGDLLTVVAMQCLLTKFCFDTFKFTVCFWVCQGVLKETNSQARQHSRK